MLVDSEGFGFSTSIADYLSYQLVKAAGGSSISAGGPLGDNYLVVTQHTSCTFRSLPSPVTTLYFGGRFRSTSFSTGVNFISPLGTVQVAIEMNANGTLTAYRGDHSAQIGQVTGVIPSGIWYYMEVCVTISATVGVVIVRINGSTVLNLTAQNTKADASSSQIGWVAFPAAEFGADLNVAHLYFVDTTGSINNTFLGDVRVQTVVPVSNDVVQFTPNGLSNNYQNAALIPPVPATDFNSDATPGDQDTFNCGTIAVGLTTIFGVAVKTLMMRPDAGMRQAAALIKSSGTVVVGPTLNVPLSTTQVKMLQETDPATGAAWTRAGFNAMKVGYKVIA